MTSVYKMRPILSRFTSDINMFLICCQRFYAAKFT